MSTKIKKGMEGKKMTTNFAYDVTIYVTLYVMGPTESTATAIM